MTSPIAFFREKIASMRHARLLDRGARATPGSSDWLVARELQYGGLVKDVPRNKLSPEDPRSAEKIRKGGMMGGDRMDHHGYGPKYAEYLAPYISSQSRITLVEVGILMGTGLAIWCELFPHSRIIGLDIDLGYTRRNWEHLKSLGAFTHNEPELYEFDQFVDNRALFASILGDDQIDICIDDGFHSKETIMGTLDSALPYLAKHFVYFVEDNASVHEVIASRYPDLKVDPAGELTVASRR